MKRFRRWRGQWTNVPVVRYFASGRSFIWRSCWQPTALAGADNASESTGGRIAEIYRFVEARYISDQTPLAAQSDGAIGAAYKPGHGLWREIPLADEHRLGRLGFATNHTINLVVNGRYTYYGGSYGVYFADPLVRTSAILMLMPTISSRRSWRNRHRSVWAFAGLRPRPPATPARCPECGNSPAGHGKDGGRTAADRLIVHFRKEFMEKVVSFGDSLRVLDSEIIQCRRCPRLREYCGQVAIEKRKAFADWEYWGKPVPGFGDVRAGIWIVGLAPGRMGQIGRGGFSRATEAGIFFSRRYIGRGWRISRNRFVEMMGWRFAGFISVRPRGVRRRGINRCRWSWPIARNIWIGNGIC